MKHIHDKDGNPLDPDTKPGVAIPSLVTEADDMRLVDDKPVPHPQVPDVEPPQAA